MAKFILINLLSRELAILTLHFLLLQLQFVQFERNYKEAPKVLISVDHSSTISGNLAPERNGITAWVEVRRLRQLHFTAERFKTSPRLSLLTPKRAGLNIFCWAKTVLILSMDSKPGRTTNTTSGSKLPRCHHFTAFFVVDLLF